MPLKKKKTFARFNVGAMMKAKKECRTNVAIAHKSVQEAIKTADAITAKRRRLETKVYNDIHINYINHIVSYSTHVIIFHTNIQLSHIYHHYKLMAYISLRYTQLQKRCSIHLYKYKLTNI